MTPPIRILHILLSLNSGGLENRVARLARGLPPEHYQVELLSLRPATLKEIEVPDRIAKHFFDLPSGFHPRLILKLANRIREGRYDVVHTHNWSTMFEGLIAARLAQVPILLHGEHGLESNQSIPWKRKAIQALLARTCTAIIAVNENIGRHVRENWGVSKERLRVIPNGVNLGVFFPTESAPDEFVVGTVGRFDSVKDFPTLIRGFAQFRNRTQATAILRLVGGGKLEKELRALATELEVDKHVQFVGQTSNPGPEYRKMSVYVNSSIYEGMSNTLLEAMASGLPLVASAVPGNQEWLRQENALFFRAGQHAELATHLETIWRNPELVGRMGKANRERVIQEFDNEQFLKSYAQFYDSLRLN